MAADYFPGRTSIDERAGIVQRRVNAGLDQALFAMFEAIGDAIAEAAEEATTRTSQRFIDFAAFLAGPQSAEHRRAANETLGLMMHDSVKRAYRAHKRATATYSPPSPTRGVRGALGKALEDPGNIFRATADGLFFINETGLSRDALQWARLNFGAGQRGRGSIGPFTVRFSDLVVAEFGLDEPARPAFTIPRGYFWDGEHIVGASAGARGAHPFYPAELGPAGDTQLAGRGRNGRFSAAGERAASTSIARRRTTQGIAGFNFLDKGLERLALNFGPVYTRMYEQVFSDSLRVGGRTFSTFVARPVTRHPFAGAR